jgi:biopolymer transport protein ExbB
MSRRHLWIPAVLILWVTLLPCHAQNDRNKERLEEALATARQNAVKATESLISLRDRIADERLPLAAELEKLESEVAELRGDAERLRILKNQDESARKALDRDVEQMRDEYTFIFTLLQEYRRSFETRLEVAESLVLAPKLKKVDEWLERNESPTNFLASAEALLSLAESWNLQKLGGARHTGLCLDASGAEHEGTFSIHGPAAYFRSSSGDSVGLVVTRKGSSRPSLFPDLDPRFVQSIASLVQGKESLVPLDITAGDALKVAARKQSLKDHLVSGGLVMVPLLLIGLVATLLTVLKFAALSKIRAPSDSIMENVALHIREGREKDAQALVDDMVPPYQTVLQAGIEHHALRREHLEEILHERALTTVPVLDRHLGMLAVLGGVAPLLGLLGTVTGMIHTFELVTIFGTGDAKLLSGGISEALVTTETGLVIAVPVLLIHAYLTRRVRTIVSGLEQMVVGFLNLLHAEGHDEA